MRSMRAVVAEVGIMKTDRPLYGMDLPRRELTDNEKSQIRALDARVCGACGHTWARRLFGRCAECDCVTWRPPAVEE